jgi:hypothetical protein
MPPLSFPCFTEKSTGCNFVTRACYSTALASRLQHAKKALEKTPNQLLSLLVAKSLFISNPTSQLMHHYI